MVSNRIRAEDSRRRTQEKQLKAEKRDKELLNEKHKAIAAMVSKSARLRELRLAKEANDRDAVAREAAETLEAKKKSKKPTVAKKA
jgi:parvulin-like peptidyl-prolyl isomerase